MTIDEVLNLSDEMKPSEMPQRVWETYEVMVTVCNSLNAMSGLYIHGGHATNPEYLGMLLLKAQGVITVLLEETGRFDEVEKWSLKNQANSRSEQSSK